MTAWTTAWTTGLDDWTRLFVLLPPPPTNVCLMMSLPPATGRLAETRGCEKQPTTYRTTTTSHHNADSQVPYDGVYYRPSSSLRRGSE